MTIPRQWLVDNTSTHSGMEDGTSKDGQDSLVDGLNLPRLKHITGEEGYDEQHDKDEERP